MDGQVPAGHKSEAVKLKSKYLHQLKIWVKLTRRKDMQQLNFPAYKFDITQKRDKYLIFDIIRKKNVLLTPEEWVRQNFVRFMLEELDYPRSMVKVESGLKVNQLQKRSDVLVYDRSAIPFLLAECKSWKVPISQSAFDQILIYNQEVKAPYLVLTNGIHHFCCAVDLKSGKARFLDSIPVYLG